jgi:Zn-dependent peptidase ImmA (M78 family)
MVMGTPWNEHCREEEDEANLFAMYLLMPEEFVRREVSKMKDEIDLESGKQIAELAKKFQVSVPLMTIRLGQIYKPALYK